MKKWALILISSAFLANSLYPAYNLCAQAFGTYYCLKSCPEKFVKKAKVSHCEEKEKANAKVNQKDNDENGICLFENPYQNQTATTDLPPLQIITVKLSLQHLLPHSNQQILTHSLVPRAGPIYIILEQIVV